jgi:hypothetical protein
MKVAGVQWWRGHLMVAMMANYEVAAGVKRKMQIQKSNDGGGSIRMPSDPFRRVKHRWQGVCGMSAMVPWWGYGGAALLGQWRRCIHGAHMVVYCCWRGVGAAFRCAGRWQRRWRQHVSGTMVGALLGRRAVAAHLWVGGGVVAMLGPWRPQLQQSTIDGRSKGGW